MPPKCSADNYLTRRLQRRAAHLNPAHFQAINPYGTPTFPITAVLNRAQRRPLRNDP